MASIYKCNGKTIRPGQQFVDADGTTHPGSWYTYSVEQKTALGITEIVQQPHPNSVLYNWGYNDDGTVTSTAKALDDINEVDENGDAIRTKATAMEDAITAAADTDAVSALFVTYTVEDDDSITKSGILYDWPVLLDN